MLATLFTNFSRHPFKTVIHVTPIDALQFPAVTICNLNDLHRSKLDNNALGIANLSQAVSAIVLTASFLAGRLKDTPIATGQLYPDSVLDLTYHNLTQAAYPSLNETLLACFWDGAEEKCEQVFRPIDLELKRCFQFNWNVSDARVTRRIGLKNGLVLLVDIHQDEYLFNDHLSAGIQVILHEPGTVPDINSGFMAAPGFITNARTTVTKRKYLPAPFKAFGSEACVDDVELPVSVSDDMRHMTYTHAMCQHLCFMLWTQKKCGCRLTESLLTGNLSIPLCTIKDFFGCYQQNYAAVRDLLSGGDLACECPRLCSRVEYEVSTSTAYYPADTAAKILRHIMQDSRSDEYIRKNYVALRIFFDDLVSHEVVHVPEYTPESIIGSIGGHMGLFIGASLLSIVELVELLLRLAARAARALCTRIHSHVMPTRAR